jgi:regulatory protein
MCSIRVIAARNLRYAGPMGKSRAGGAKLDENGLEQAALHYLERYSSSAAGLRRVLRRRIRRAARLAGNEEGQTDIAAGDAMIETVLTRLVRTGLLDDARYAEFRAGSLARRGGSLYVIRRDLKIRGIAAPLIEAALAALKRETGAESNDETDLAAALALAKRRRMGPFRLASVRAAYRMRDLAALGRAGFAFEIAKRVIDGEAENG